MLATVWIACVALVSGVGSSPSQMTEAEVRALMETCIRCAGSEYENAVSKLDEVFLKRGSYGGWLDGYSGTWQGRLLRRILASRTISIEVRRRPGRIHRAALGHLHNPPATVDRAKNGVSPPPLAIAPPRPISTARLKSRRKLMRDTITTALPASIEFLWKLSEGTEWWKRANAVRTIGHGTGVADWEAFGFDMVNRHPEWKSYGQLMQDLGEFLMYLLEREPDAWVRREIQILLAKLPDERVLQKVRERSVSAGLAQPVRQRFTEVVPVLEQYLNRLKAKSSGTTQPTR